MLGLQIYSLDFGGIEVCHINRWDYIWDQIRHANMLPYATPRYSNRVLILKTQNEKWEINSGCLEGYNLYKKRSDAPFS